MPTRPRFNKKNAQTFSVVHRAHDDALYFDNDATRHVLVPTSTSRNQNKKDDRKKKVFNLADLEQDFQKKGGEKIRDNEGLAAQYGVYYDDTKYDYMQHLKPMGNGEGVFISTTQPKKKERSIEEFFEGQLPSKETIPVSHDVGESIPEELRGLNPDLDPRIRETLTALEDDAYIEQQNISEEGTQRGEKGDIFQELIRSGQAKDEDEFYDNLGDIQDEDDFDEWDLDNYNDDFDSENGSEHLEVQDLPYNEGEAPDELVGNQFQAVDTNWEKDFQEFKRKTKDRNNDWDSDDDFEEEEDEVPELPNIGKGGKSNTKMRKKKGAKTDTSSFSMSSSALYRTEGLSLLDDRYEQMYNNFENEGEEDDYEEFDMKKERNDFEGMLDDFLDNYEIEKGGRKYVKKNKEQTKLKEAADSVSNSKLARRRRKEKDHSENPIGKLGSSFGSLKI